MRNYQKIWTLFKLSGERTLFFANRMVKQVRQFHWYWDGTRFIIELLCNSRESKDICSQFFVLFRLVAVNESLVNSRSIRTVVVPFSLFREQPEWNSNERNEKNLSCSLLRKKIHKYHIRLLKTAHKIKRKNKKLLLERGEWLCEVKDVRYVVCISIQCNWIMKTYFICFAPT